MDYVILMFKMLTGGLNRFSRGHFAKDKCGQMGLPSVLSIGQGIAGNAVLYPHSCRFPNITGMWMNLLFEFCGEFT